MKKIKPEVVDYLYLYNSDVSKLDDVDLPLYGFSHFMIEQSKNSSDIRLILIYDFLNSKSADIHYLYWQNGQDLDELDVKVQDNTFTPEDFLHSAITYDNKTHCFKCNYTWHTLVFIDDYYFGNPELRLSKFKEFEWQSCPNCGEKFRIHVVKVYQLVC